MAEPTASGRQDSDRRNRGGDVRRGSVMSGVLRVMNGAVFRAMLSIILAILTIDSIDVQTLVHNATASGHPISPVGPMIEEYTSGVGTIGFSWIAYGALRVAWPGRARWLVLLGVHLAAASLFSVAHVATMVLLRDAIHAVIGGHHHWALSDFFYEYRKDLPAYLLIAVIFWTFQQLASPPVVTPIAAPARTFDIVDGARTTRVAMDEIVSARSAGNYVEFRLADRRALLMRATLAEVERGLAAAGFVRTHRSWIVSTRRVRQIEPAGSGDYRVTLDDGTEAPVSRRYPEALARLRDGPLVGAERD